MGARFPCRSACSSTCTDPVNKAEGRLQASSATRCLCDLMALVLTCVDDVLIAICHVRHDLLMPSLKY